MNKGFDPNRQCDCHGCEQARRINEARKRREHYTANPHRFAEQMAVFARMRETEAEFRARRAPIEELQALGWEQHNGDD